MTEKDAMERHSINANVMRLYRNEASPGNMHFEFGRDVGAPMPYKQHRFVYISPEGTNAHFGDITLRIWSKMCDYFSNNTIQTDAAAGDEDTTTFRQHFEEYTMLKATPANITAAFEEGVMKRSDELQTKAPLRRVTPAKKKTKSDTNTTVQDLIPSEERLRNVLEKRYKQLEQKDVATDTDLTKIGGLMKVAEIDSIQFKATKTRRSAAKVEVNMMFTVCTCGRNKVCEVRKNQTMLCTKCSTKQSLEKRYEQRRTDNADMRVAPDSSVPITSLKPIEQTVRIKKLNQERNRKDQLHKRLLDKLAKFEELKVEEMSDEMVETSKKSLQYANDNPKELRNELARTLYEIIEEEYDSIGGTSPFSHSNVESLVETLTDEIKNQCRMWNKQSKQCKYSSKLIGVAMSLYLRSGRGKYEKFREDSTLVYPSAHYLTKMKQSQQIKDGCCITMYEDQMKMRGGVKEEVGQLVVDEMKLRKDVIMNVSSDAIIGVTDDFISTKKIIKSLLDDENSDDLEDIDDFNEPATYVNQWRYRSVTGRTYNCEFFYNNGTLSGDALLEQFTRVVMNCETIGSRVLSLVCDAGGNNVRLISLLREGGLLFPTSAWVGEESVRTVNPYDSSRYIYLIHRATHDLKALRNALFISWVPNGAREFIIHPSMY